MDQIVLSGLAFAFSPLAVAVCLKHRRAKPLLLRGDSNGMGAYFGIL